MRVSLWKHSFFKATLDTAIMTKIIPAILLFALFKIAFGGDSLLEEAIARCADSTNACVAGCWNPSPTNSLLGASECLPVGFGWYSPSGDVRRYPCGEGMFSEAVDSSYCNPCPAGSYNDRPTAKNCKYCPSGSYSIQAGARNCFSCDSSHYNGIGSDFAYVTADETLICLEPLFPLDPTDSPTLFPTSYPTTIEPTREPTREPTLIQAPSKIPTIGESRIETGWPTSSPSPLPSSPSPSPPAIILVPPTKPPSLTIPVTIHINCTNFTDPKNNNSSPDPATTDDELLDMHESDSDAGTAGDSDGDASIQQKERDRSSRQQKRRENIRRYVPSLLILLMLGLLAILYRRYQLNKKGGTKLSSRPTPPPPKKDFHTAPTWVVKTGREQEDDNQSTVAASVWSMSAGNRPEEEEEKNKDWLSV